MPTLKEMKAAAKAAFLEKHKDDVDLSAAETTGNKGTTVHHKWEAPKAEDPTKDEILIARRQAQEEKRDNLFKPASDEVR